MNIQPDKLQKLAMSIMVVMVFVTFIGANLQALLWQSSDWLVTTVLPAVVVDLTNAERSQNAETPLQRNAVLDAAARLKAEDMAKNEYFAHFSPTGVSPWHWFDEVDYVYAHAGENLAIHFTDSSEVVEAWMNSPAHRDNIVNGKYTEIGVGTAKGTYDGYDTVYVVQLFGTPAVPPATAKVAKTPPPTATRENPPVLATSETVETRSMAVPSLTAEPQAVPPNLTQVAGNQVVSPALEVTPSVTETVPSLATATTELTETVDESPVNKVEAVGRLEVESVPVKEITIVQSDMIATSSGLAIANIVTQNSPHAGATVASIVTEPNRLLQLIYMVLGVLVLLLLSFSIALQAKRFNYRQVAYSVMLLIGMGGLWFVHSLLTTGAVIV